MTAAQTKAAKALTPQQIARAIAEHRIRAFTETHHELTGELETPDAPYSFADLERAVAAQHKNLQPEDCASDAGYLLGLEVGRLTGGVR